MTQATGANKMLMGGKVKSAKLTLGGPKVTGTIVEEPTEVQMRDYDTDELLWLDPPKGSPEGTPKQPKNQIRTLIQTELRDGDDDDGIRALFLKGDLRMKTRDACRAAGSPQGLEIGGRITVEVVRTEPCFNDSGKPLNDQKIHAVTYVKPTPRSNLDGSAAGAAPAAATTQAAPTSAPKPATPREIVRINGEDTDITDLPAAAKALAYQAAGGEVAGPTEPPF